ncbi:hypothetical protein [Membranihabitans maritimus]|uniref:hypothetical protein n=1 Tax=Membranihabitans maritimus TaxID=2904244 RepID=UPI001F405E08|nr:hypothetical protein [Membranihabitans maritimus]
MFEKDPIRTTGFPEQCYWIPSVSTLQFAITLPEPVGAAPVFIRKRKDYFEGAWIDKEKLLVMREKRRFDDGTGLERN